MPVNPSPLRPPRHSTALALGSRELIFSFSQQRSAALKLDWTKVTSSLGLRGQTVASLQAFKKRNEDVRRKVQQLGEQPTTVDFAQYRSVLKNQAIVDEIEKRFKAFTPVSYDVSRQLKAIDAFEAEAVKNAEATKQAVDLELKDLAATLKNIEEARPFEDLTVVRITDSGMVDWIFTLCRTRLPPPRSRSTRRPPSSFPRADGWCRVTRCVLWNPRPVTVLTPAAGEVWRPGHGLIELRIPDPGFALCTLAL